MHHHASLPPSFFSIVTAQIDSTEFQVDKSLTVVSIGSTGTEATVEVTYEPTSMGESLATLIISSATGASHIQTHMIQNVCTVL